jgi:hypothetical protein
MHAERFPLFLAGLAVAGAVVRFSFALAAGFSLAGCFALAAPFVGMAYCAWEWSRIARRANEFERVIAEHNAKMEARIAGILSMRPRRVSDV